ncbi:MAG: SGNH/GDSL hydrolase family protein [Thiogranum sp.]
MRKLGLYTFFFLLLPYGVAEVLAGFLYAYGIIEPTPSFFVFEESSKTVHFDPVLGYRFTPVPSRFTEITFGRPEFLASFSGNSQGFNAPYDFIPQRTDPDTFRIAVFGDSFTAAEYLSKSWPTVVEDLARKDGPDLELLNFSISGAGLANWWSILKGLVEAEDYDVDALLFAVFHGDLGRGFSVADHRNTDRHRFGRVPSWDPATWPQTLNEAQQYMEDLRGFVVDDDRYEQAINGDWNPDLPRPWKPYLSQWLLRLVKSVGKDEPIALQKDAAPHREFNPGQLILIENIYDYASRNQLPVMVVRLPSRPELLSRLPPPSDVGNFSEQLQAMFVDGAQAFSDLSEAEVRAHWLPYDGHWAQKGSDRFAEFMYRQIEHWIRKTPRPQQEPKISG